MKNGVFIATRIFLFHKVLDVLTPTGIRPLHMIYTLYFVKGCLTLCITNGQTENEPGSFSLFAFHPDLSTMSLNSDAAECQPNPQTGRPVFTRSFKSCKFFKNAFMVRWRDTGSTVLYPEFQHIAFSPRPDLNIGPGLREFDRILQEIDEHAPYHVGIHPDVGQVCLSLHVDRLAAAR